MKTAVKKLYEAMFLVDSAQASDWDVVVKNIKTILKRADAEIASIRNWAERKLAYEIDNKSRGTYVLCYFKADGEKIRNIEKDVQLSEQIMRVLILSAETREKDALEDSIAPPGSQAHEVGDESGLEKEEDETVDVETKEDIVAVPLEKPAEQQAADAGETEQKKEDH